MFTIDKVENVVTKVTATGNRHVFSSLEAYIRFEFRYIYGYNGFNVVSEYLSSKYVEGLLRPNRFYYGPEYFDWYITNHNKFQIVNADGSVVSKARLIQLAADIMPLSYFDYHPPQRKHPGRKPRGSHRDHYGKFRTFGAMKMAVHVFEEDGEPPMRGRRKLSSIPNWYDECRNTRIRDSRSWKDFRKTQWK